jgi:hypothetical protein
MKRLRGIPGLLLQKARITHIPSKQGPCEGCNENGEVRYFVAAKLPRHIYLCNKHYLKIRNQLEKALGKIVREEGLL